MPRLNFIVWTVRVSSPSSHVTNEPMFETNMHATNEPTFDTNMHASFKSFHTCASEVDYSVFEYGCIQYCNKNVRNLIIARMANSVDPDETAHDEPSHLDIHCLQMIVFYSTWLKGWFSVCFPALQSPSQTGFTLKWTNLNPFRRDAKTILSSPTRAFSVCLKSHWIR